MSVALKHPCIHCTVPRCDHAGMTCSECLGNIAAAASQQCSEAEERCRDKFRNQGSFSRFPYLPEAAESNAKLFGCRPCGLG